MASGESTGIRAGVRIGDDNGQPERQKETGQSPSESVREARSWLRHHEALERSKTTQRLRSEPTPEVVRWCGVVEVPVKEVTTTRRRVSPKLEVQDPLAAWCGRPAGCGNRTTPSAETRRENVSCAGMWTRSFGTVAARLTLSHDRRGRVCVACGAAPARRRDHGAGATAARRPGLRVATTGPERAHLPPQPARALGSTRRPAVGP